LQNGEIAKRIFAYNVIQDIFFGTLLLTFCARFAPVWKVMSLA